MQRHTAALQSAAQAQRLVGRPAARELVPTLPGTSARWHMHDYPGPYCRWNYHPEYEVHLIRRGTGRYIMGDRIGRFSAGHLALVGSNLPHHWISDLAPGERLVDRDVVFQFHPQWIQDCQQLLPELKAVDPLLTRAARGVEFVGKTAVRAASDLVAIGSATGLERIRHILALLDTLNRAPSADFRLLASPWLPPLDDPGAADVVDHVLGYIFAQSAGEIRMREAAALVGMSESTFSRYFARTAGHTFSDTVRKLRLAHACQLLENTDDPIAAIAHRVGYQNLSNFNRQFRLELGATPREYRRAHRAARPAE